jgi:hypothetical protein
MIYGPHGTLTDVSTYPSIQSCGRRYDIVSDTGVEPVQLRIPNPAAYQQALSERYGVGTLFRDQPDSGLCRRIGLQAVKPTCGDIQP